MAQVPNYVTKYLQIVKHRTAMREAYKEQDKKLKDAEAELVAQSMDWLKQLPSQSLEIPEALSKKGKPGSRLIYVEKESQCPLTYGMLDLLMKQYFRMEISKYIPADQADQLAMLGTDFIWTNRETKTKNSLREVMKRGKPNNAVNRVQVAQQQRQ